jgi:hypothetical protein
MVLETHNKKRRKLIVYSIFIRHGPLRKQRVQQFFYCCVYIPFHSKLFTEPWRSNERRTHKMMGEIYEV